MGRRRECPPLAAALRSRASSLRCGVSLDSRANAAFGVIRAAGAHPPPHPVHLTTDHPARHASRAACSSAWFMWEPDARHGVGAGGRGVVAARRGRKWREGLGNRRRAARGRPRKGPWARESRETPQRSEEAPERSAGPRGVGPRRQPCDPSDLSSPFYGAGFTVSAGVTGAGSGGGGAPAGSRR
jgi:hypothetical protein